MKESQEEAFGRNLATVLVFSFMHAAPPNVGRIALGQLNQIADTFVQSRQLSASESQGFQSGMEEIARIIEEMKEALGTMP